MDMYLLGFGVRKHPCAGTQPTGLPVTNDEGVEKYLLAGETFTAIVCRIHAHFPSVRMQNLKDEALSKRLSSHGKSCITHCHLPGRD